MECPNCRASQSDERTFCSSCGADLKTGKNVVPPELLAGGGQRAATKRRRPAAMEGGVPPELMPGGEHLPRSDGPQVLPMIGAGILAVAVVVGAVFGIRFLAAHSSSIKTAKIPKSQGMSEFGNFGGRLSVRVIDWRPGTEPREYLATFQGEQKGMGVSLLDPSEFVVVDPKGGRHDPDGAPEPVEVTTTGKEVVQVVYRLPLIKGEYELVWFQKGRRVGGWKVGCYKC